MCPASLPYPSFNSRRLLLHTQLYNSPPGGAELPPPRPFGVSEPYTGNPSFDANAVTVLAVLLCALICALGLNTIIRRVLRCSTQIAFDSGAHSATETRLVNTGVKGKALSTFPTVTYSNGSDVPDSDTECVICLSEFATGDRVRVLPKCHHGFHVRCIDKWLVSHSSCPTCRQCLTDTCQKIVGCAGAAPSDPPPLLHPIIVPLEPEGLIVNYGGVY